MWTWKGDGDSRVSSDGISLKRKVVSFRLVYSSVTLRTLILLVISGNL